MGSPPPFQRFHHNIRINKIFSFPTDKSRPSQLSPVATQHIGSSVGHSAVKASESLDSSATSASDEPCEFVMVERPEPDTPVDEDAREIKRRRYHGGYVEQIESPAFEPDRYSWGNPTPVDLSEAPYQPLYLGSMGGASPSCNTSQTTSTAVVEDVPHLLSYLTQSAPVLRHLTMSELPPSSRKDWASCPELPARCMTS